MCVLERIIVSEPSEASIALLAMDGGKVMLQLHDVAMDVSTEQIRLATSVGSITEATLSIDIALANPDAGMFPVATEIDPCIRFLIHDSQRQEWFLTCGGMDLCRHCINEAVLANEKVLAEDASVAQFLGKMLGGLRGLEDSSPHDRL